MKASQVITQTQLIDPFNPFISEPVFGDKRSAGLSSAELKRVQRICLELYCQYETSLPFRELESESNTAYYEIVQK